MKKEIITLTKLNNLRHEFNTYRTNLIKLICEAITNAKAIEIKLEEPISYQYIDDQANESIDRINAEQESVMIDCAGFGDDYSKKLSELSIEMLLEILDVIRQDNFEIWEEVSEN